MVEQAIDFREESDVLADLLEGIEDQDWDRKTLFKGWTVSDVIVHLHFFNIAADMSLTEPDKFDGFLADLMAALGKGEPMNAYSYRWLNGLKGRPLFDAWRAYYPPMAERFVAADPEARVKWAGPDMSARMSITARQMETWAHGQALFDLFGKTREEADRLKNIAFIGVRTYGWTFAVRGQEPPGEPPYVRLTAPSGAVWEFNAPDEANAVSGDAVEFCQVVAQTRNVADTKLSVIGEPAKKWMAIAQCFAGPPEDPPAPGARRSQAA